MRLPLPIMAKPVFALMTGVLVQRFSQRFEGRDRRFIAVTGQAR
jgi:hypothetical protein